MIHDPSRGAASIGCFGRLFLRANFDAPALSGPKLRGAIRAFHHGSNARRPAASLAPERTECSAKWCVAASPELGGKQLQGMEGGSAAAPDFEPVIRQIADRSVRGDGRSFLHAVPNASDLESTGGLF